ncbi:MAG: flagellin [Candidatus Anaerobiospirillum pullicola]|uniref:Flagellin n=1 Tax=Candidatus Anaerobiospirillum pullicola TaxID=2838451 RepID=A0A948WZI9_9GAMM|nr:flagellin [Candidatus Anaerobiospirillum pullicola]
MAIYVNTNVSSLNGQRFLTNANNALNTTYQRLSSGLRINSAKDDAAGLQIADRLTAQINGLNQGNRNTNDGIALAQTIEGGMDEIHTMLQSIRTLAVQAANGTNTAEDRKALEDEANQLVSEINRIAQQTTYGGKLVLDGADGTNIGSKTIYNNKAAGTSGSKANGTLNLQVGANSGDKVSFEVGSFKFSTLLEAGGVANMDTKAGLADDNATLAAGSGSLGVTFSSAETAMALINTMDMAIKQVDTQRSGLGAIQNRLESTIRNQSNVAVNEADARSRIQDADFAEESANLSQQSIIQQAAASMLMQANTRPQLGLSLIG